MPFPQEYMAADRLPLDQIVVGAECEVPVWKSGEVLGWYKAQIISVAPAHENQDTDVRIVARNEHDGGEQVYAAYSISKPIDKSDWLIPATLTVAQQDAVAHIKELNVPVNWFVGQRDARTGTVEVVAIGSGDEPTFVWTFTIEPDGTYSDHEANAVEFSTGITV